MATDNVFGTDLIYDSGTANNELTANGWLVGPNGDYAEISGVTNLRNWMWHCLITNPGEYKPRPKYGVGVPRYVKQKMTTANLHQLKSDIISNLLFDQRITAVDVTLSAQLINGKTVLTILISPTVGGNLISVPPFSFTGT